MNSPLHRNFGIYVPRPRTITTPSNTTFIRVWTFARMFLAVFVPGAVVILVWWLGPMLMEWMAG